MWTYSLCKAVFECLELSETISSLDIWVYSDTFRIDGSLSDKVHSNCQFHDSDNRNQLHRCLHWSTYCTDSLTHSSSNTGTHWSVMIHTISRDNLLDMYHTLKSCFINFKKITTSKCCFPNFKFVHNILLSLISKIHSYYGSGIN